MNDPIAGKTQHKITGRCLVLPVVVIILLFTACGSPVSGKVSKLPARQPTEAHMDQTPRAAQATDNPTNGKLLFNTFQPTAGIACATCHRVDSEERLVGPGLLNVGKRAGTRVPGMSAVEYLRQSIVSPSAYIIEGYTDLMPKNWGRVFSDQQIDDLIAYLLTLKQDSDQSAIAR